MKLDGGGGGGASEYGGADGTGLIDPDLFPLKSIDIDLEGVLAAATAFTSMGERVENGSSDLTDSWAPLANPGVYAAPEGYRVHQLMQPAVTAGEDFAERASTASSALVTFCTGLIIRFVPTRLKNLEEEARAFRDDVRDGVPRPAEGRLQNLIDAVKGDTEETVEWYESYEHVKKNEELLASYAEILEDVSTAACTTAEAIQAIPGMPKLPDPEPYDTEAIGSASMPWGSPRSELSESLQVAFGVANTVKGLALSLVSLAGWDGDNWSVSNIGRSWKGLGNGLLGLVALGVRNKVGLTNGDGHVTPEDIERLLNSDDPLERWLGSRLRDGQSMALPFAAGESVDLEDAARRWRDRPWQVGTETALAWLLLFAPGPKVGKGIPMSPAARSMLDDMLEKAELVQTGAGWFTKGGIRVADETGRWLGDRLYGGSGGEKGGKHMWTPGEPELTPSDRPGGDHKREPKHKLEPSR